MPQTHAPAPGAARPRGGSDVRDVVVVGGGIAGLTAAWHLRHRDVLLLEGSDRLGGRMRSDRRGGYWLNFGAHLMPGPGTLVDGLIREHGLETIPVTGGMMGLAVGRTRLTGGRPETYPLRLDLPLRDRVAFARAGLRLRRAVKERAALARPRPGDTPEAVRARVLAYEGDRAFAAFLGDLPRGAADVLACAARRATAEPEELSAGCGVGLFALVWAGGGSLIARTLLGGSGRLPEALGRALGERARTGAAVRAIEPETDGTLSVHTQGADGVPVRARHVILAAQAPLAAPLAAHVAPQAADALARMTYGPFLVVAVETAETTAMPWDDTYAIATPGRAFDLFTNQAHALRSMHHGARRPGGSLMLFAGGHHAAALAREDDATVVARFLEDLHDLYPESRGLVADAVVHRWELGNVYAHPGRDRLQAPLEGALGAHANLHLAGDHFAELGNLEAAARTGADAAARVDAQLGAPLTSKETQSHA